MPPVPRPPLVKRLPPGAWTALAWVAATGFAVLAWVPMGFSVPIPGLPAGDNYHYYPGFPSPASLLVAAVLILAGSALLRRAPPPALRLLLAGSIIGATAFVWSHVWTFVDAGRPTGATITMASPGQYFEFLPVAVALYVVAAGRSRRTAVAALALALVGVAGYMAVEILEGFRVVAATEFAVAMTGLVAWLAGTSSR